MMDSSELSPAGGLEAVHQNGVYEELADSEKHGVVSNDADSIAAEITETVAQNGNLGNGLLDNTETNISVAESKEDSNGSTVSNNVAITKQEDVKITDQSEQLRTSKGPVKTKAVKLANPKGVHTSGVKKSKDRKDEEALPSVLNGSLMNSRQPIKGKSFNDRRGQISKHSEKPDAASSGSPMETKTPKALKKGTLDKIQGEESSSNITAEDAKPPKVGMLPNYGFSFNCDERAERRKEFYSKLEEKIHAKEVEKSNLQAKTKETQEAEIKKLRKSLGFKATPMPSFYQEPPPPKVELKKIPTTRARSPKLGRRKNSTGSELDGSPCSSAPLGCLSLDEKVSKSNPIKKITHAHPKKLQRRSLPSKLPSEKSSSSKALNDEKATSSSIANKGTTLSNTGEKERCQVDAANEENVALSCNTSEAPSLNIEQNAVLSDNPIDTEPQVNGDIVVEEQPQLRLAQELVETEH